MVTLRARGARLLDERDLPELARLLDSDPVANVFVAGRVEVAGLDPLRLGAEVWGFSGDGGLLAACYVGANLVPIATPHGWPPAALRAFAEHGRRQGRRCSSLLGPAELVLDLWRELEPAWGPAREVREDQPLLLADAASRVPPDPAVRRVSLSELDLVLPACVAMFTEEIGISPLVGDGGALYRARVHELIAGGRAFARIERATGGSRVVFKAELGAVSRRACQIQGVWTDPALRGQGIGTAGTAAVVDAALRDVAPLVSLYVNAFNVPARRAYQRIGFRQVGTFASVLF